MLLPTRNIMLGVLSLFVTPAAGAQPAAYRVERLAPDVHVVLRNSDPSGAADSNVLIVINEADVVVVDTNIFPSSARQVIGEIRKLTTKPVRYVVNTHWHSDHHYGNQAYRDAYPGVEFIQHPVTRENIVTRDMPDLDRNLNVEYPAALGRFRKALETGRTSRGDSVTAAMRADFTSAAGVYEFFIKDMKDNKPVPGTVTVADSLVLHRGDRPIVVKFLGVGNTLGDLVVHLPKEGIVASGDLVVHPTPFAFESNPDVWPATLRALLALNAKIIVPGHGAVQRDARYVNRLIELFESVTGQVAKAVAGGSDLETSISAVKLDSFAADFGGNTETGRKVFETVLIRPVVESAFNRLKAQKN